MRFWAVASGVSPAAQHSTMIGPLKPADFSTSEDPREVHLARAELE